MWLGGRRRNAVKVEGLGFEGKGLRDHWCVVGTTWTAMTNARVLDGVVTSRCGCRGLHDDGLKNE